MEHPAPATALQAPPSDSNQSPSANIDHKADQVAVVQVTEKNKANKQGKNKESDRKSKTSPQRSRKWSQDTTTNQATIPTSNDHL